MTLVFAAAAALQLLTQSATAPAGQVYHGRLNATAAAAPRLEADVEIDGILDEAAWAHAAVLTGFSQYEPVDGLPAADSTEVLVWYSPYALHIGVRAFEPHASVNATLADRDKIFADDYVQIMLDPFNDRRRALLFALNPLGVQADGYQTEEQRSSGGFFSADATSARIDLSPDFVFQSKGRVSDDGYQIEIRIPFKSLRYPATQPQTWGINVLRRVQHAGQVQTWTPARRGETSFLAQSGTLTGLDDLRRGLVMDLNPVLTNRAVGAADAAGSWGYEREPVELGMNARWGITTDLTLNGTVNPDFSQVEADVAQIQFDPRQALSFPEKRPFFLEGNEQFAAPGGLIYTRRIADPDVAFKLGGRVAGLDVGVLSAVDDESLSRTGVDHPFYNVLRVRRSVGEQSTLGLTYTDRVESDDYNRVAGIDSRLVLGRYTLFAHVAASRTRTAGDVVTAPLWDFSLTRAGREFGWSLSTNGRDPDFVAGSGFTGRTGVAFLNFAPRITRFGAPGSRLQSWSGSLSFANTWLYDRFADPRPDEAKLHINNSFVLRGGWRLGTSLLIENFLYPEELYQDVAIDMGTDTVPFVGRPSINNYDVVFTLGTPQFQTWSANGFVLFGRDENFPEWAPGYIVWAELNGTWRPTERVRLQALYNETRVMRPDDWSTVTITQIPRLKLEYQLARPIFVRLVGQYVASKQDALQDDGRSDRPLLVRNPATGMYEATRLARSNQLRFDWLFSYQPTPGTVLFAGYGSTLRDYDARRTFGIDGLERTSDGFFVKLSYLFRM
jgi:hypothetical protein